MSKLECDNEIETLYDTSFFNWLDKKCIWVNNAYYYEAKKYTNYLILYKKYKVLNKNCFIRSFVYIKHLFFNEDYYKRKIKISPPPLPKRIEIISTNRNKKRIIGCRPNNNNIAFRNKLDQTIKKINDYTELEEMYKTDIWEEIVIDEELPNEGDYSSYYGC